MTHMVEITRLSWLRHQKPGQSSDLGSIIPCNFFRDLCFPQSETPPIPHLCFFLSSWSPAPPGAQGPPWLQLGSTPQLLLCPCGNMEQNLGVQKAPENLVIDNQGSQLVLLILGEGLGKHVEWR